MAGQIKAVSLERVEQRIVVIRSKKVMLSTHLAELYEVEPRALVQAVKRNLDRFPADFMRLILIVRGQRVMLDTDLAKLDGVETKVLNRAHARNRERFPQEQHGALR